MSTRDLRQVADDTEKSLLTPDAADPPDVSNPSVWRRRKRLSVGLRELMAFYREVLAPEEFASFIEGQLAKRAALDHYEETGKFGVFDATVTVGQTDEMDIERLNTELHAEVDNADTNAVSEIEQYQVGRKCWNTPEKSVCRCVLPGPRKKTD